MSTLRARAPDMKQQLPTARGSKPRQLQVTTVGLYM
jgi:hypothetical protein